MLKRNVILRLCAVLIAAVILCGSFAGCRKTKSHTEVVTSEYDVWIDDPDAVVTSSEEESEESDADDSDDYVSSVKNSSKSDNSSSSKVSGNSFLNNAGMSSTGKRISIEYLDAYLFSAHPTFYWSELGEGQKVNLYIYTADGSKEVLVKKGLTGSSYKCEATLEHGKSYLVKATYTNPDGTEKVINTVGESGKVMTCIASRVNDGKNYSFNGSLSLEVTNNYLNRAVSYSLTELGTTINYSGIEIDESLRFLLNVGAKYVQRATGQWYANASLENYLDELKAKLEAVHSVDPDIVFEACIFETSQPSMNNISIPAWVFEDFGLEPETRNFDVKKMRFETGYGIGYFDGGNCDLPDITQTEFQMFVYYRATQYIDAGFEALHLGQVLLTGRLESDNASWAKVIGMIREYAKKNARRGYVLINAHNSQFTAPDGKMLVDMIVSPIRPKPVGEKHAVSETNPQECIIEAGYWGTPYGQGISGTSPNGWYADNYPYLLEFDNYDPKGDITDPNSYVWGRDDIQWYQAQPQWYRQKFMEYVVETLKAENGNGHVAFPAHRGKTKANIKSDYCPEGLGDEDWMKALLGK